jgi:hypothetical protein
MDLPGPALAASLVEGLFRGKSGFNLPFKGDSPAWDSATVLASWSRAARIVAARVGVVARGFQVRFSVMALPVRGYPAT